MYVYCNTGKRHSFGTGKPILGCYPGANIVQPNHYNDVIMSTIASQITGLAIVYSTVYSGADQRKHQSSATLAFVQGPVNSPHKGPVTRKMVPFDDVIMTTNSPRAQFPTRRTKFEECKTVSLGFRPNIINSSLSCPSYPDNYMKIC